MNNKEALRRKINKEIEDNYNDPEFTVEVLSRKFNYSQSHFREMVYEIFSMSPKRLILMKRMNEALDLLVRGERIYMIAKQVGYLNIRSFRKAFNGVYGLSPRNYKKRFYKGEI